MAQFQKGQSGNPGGRPKVVGEVQELARSHTTAAIKTLAEIMQNEKAPCPARVAAASAILDRGYGKASQNLHHSGDMNLSLGDELDGFVRRVKAERELSARENSEAH